jgi:hypothetical protein
VGHASRVSDGSSRFDDEPESGPSEHRALKLFSSDFQQLTENLKISHSVKAFSHVVGYALSRGRRLRTAKMNTHDRDPRIVNKLYEEYQNAAPVGFMERRRSAVRLAHPKLSLLGQKLAVMETLEREDARLGKIMRKRLSVPRPEPRRMSPTEQLKMRTSILNQAGKLTGGNFGASF